MYTERRWLAVLDLITDFVFCFDIFAQFHTAVWKLIPGTAQHWELFDDLAYVRWHYLVGEFKWDLVGQIPWQYFDCIFTNFPKGLKSLRLIRLVKLTRLHRLNRRIKLLEATYGGSFRILVASLKLLVMTLFVCCPSSSGRSER